MNRYASTTAPARGDPDFDGDVTRVTTGGKKRLDLEFADVEEYSGRDIKPEDNGYLSEEHSEKYNELKEIKNRLKEYPGLSAQAFASQRQRER